MKKILVIGDLIVDYYLWGKSECFFFEVFVFVLEVKKENKNLGGVVNVVNNFTFLKVKVFLCGVVGDDLEGEYFLNVFKVRDIDILGVLIDKICCIMFKMCIIV